MYEIDSIQVLKWVLIVLAAGFIGHFGKALAEHLISRARSQRKNKESKGSAAAEGKPPEIPSGEIPNAGGSKSPSERSDAKTRSKAEKKAAKAKLKLQKKDKK